MLNVFAVLFGNDTVALDLIDYYSFMKATASYSTCVLHLDDLKA